LLNALQSGEICIGVDEPDAESINSLDAYRAPLPVVEDLLDTVDISFIGVETLSVPMIVSSSVFDDGG
jgi:hypothetical protein